MKLNPHTAFLSHRVEGFLGKITWYSNLKLSVKVIIIIIIIIIILQLSCHSVAVVLTLVQTKQIRINIHKRNNTKHTANNTKTQYKQYKNTVQTIQKHSTNNTKHSTNNTKTRYKQYKNTVQAIQKHSTNNTKHSTNNTKHSTNNTKHSTNNTKHSKYNYTWLVPQPSVFLQNYTFSVLRVGTDYRCFLQGYVGACYVAHLVCLLPERALFGTAGRRTVFTHMQLL